MATFGINKPAGKIDFMKHTLVNKNAICLNCLVVLDMATSLKNETPDPGDLGICINCKTVSQYDANLCLKPITEEFKKHLQENHPLDWGALQHHINLLNFVKE